MNRESRLLPSQVADWKMRASAPGPGRIFLEIEPKDAFVMLCDEIEACWAELELLRSIAIAAAEQIAARPQLETPLLEAVEAWQKSNRDSA